MNLTCSSFFMTLNSLQNIHFTHNILKLLYLMFQYKDLTLLDEQTENTSGILQVVFY